MKFLTHDGTLYLWKKIKAYIDTKYNELFQSVSNGKKTVANAITGKGVSTSETATFATMASNISKITTGIETDDATVVTGDILIGKTAYAKGGKLTGSMTNHGAVNQSLAINGSYTIPAGYHNGSGKVTQSIPVLTPTYSDQLLATGVSVGAYNPTDPGIYAYFGVTNNSYLSGVNWVTSKQPDLIPANILSGKTILGVAGTAMEGKFASGQATSGGSYIYVQHAYGAGSDRFVRLAVNGLSFKPKAILLVTTLPSASNTRYIEDFSGRTIYEINVDNGYGTNDYLCVLRNDSDTYVNSTSFSLPVMSSNTVYDWYAIG